MLEKSLARAYDSLEIERGAIENMRASLDEKAFSEAVDALVSAPHIMTCASGSSGIAAKKFAHTLCCIEQSAQFMPPCEAVHGGLGALKGDNVLVMVSRGGKTAELLPVIEACKKRGATLIAVTENMDAPLACAADIILPLKIERESDKYNMQATASFIATVALFDALICAVMEETNYQKAQFGVIHPGGAVGERLNKGV